MNSDELGAVVIGPSMVQFNVWAPYAKSIEVHVISPETRTLELEKDDRGYFWGLMEGIPAGSRYFYELDSQKKCPDPASRYQPEGIFGPSEVIDHSTFEWTDEYWRGIPLARQVIYELHVGTYTMGGDFLSIIPFLDELADLGVTTLELMPIAQFSGKRNWGYDGVLPFAVQNSYGRPEDLKALVDAAHRKNLAVILDVVYNHLGPEGNCFHEFGPYFTDHYKTPWGQAINFDQAYSSEVRRYFISNAVSWIRDYHLDGLRLDAVHSILDQSAKHFLQELTEEVQSEARRTNRRVQVIAESDLNNERLVLAPEQGGYGLDAHWADDFHHALHALVTGEREGYYQDYGRLQDLAEVYREGFLFKGQYSEYRRRNHGAPARRAPLETFLVCAQNHDQIGNRASGDRLNQTVSFETYKLCAAALLLSPFTPLIFMGEEYAEPAPFQFFVDHQDPGLIDAVRMGRRNEFKNFNWPGEIPFPDSPETFERSRLNHDLKKNPFHERVRNFYRELIQLRQEFRERGLFERGRLYVVEDSARSLLELHYSKNTTIAIVELFFAAPEKPSSFPRFHQRLDSFDPQWMGVENNQPGPTARVFSNWVPRSFL